MIREKLIMVCTCEMAGRVRGKGFPATELPARMISGVGWIPTNTMISCLGPIADSPFGATGELLLVPDPAAEIRVDFDDGGAAEHFFLGDIFLPDGTPWECCPRDFLRRALAALHAETGLSLLCAFEHEFSYDGVPDDAHSAYTLAAWRRQGVFGEVLAAALRQAGIVPDSFMPEYGVRQFEITCEPAAGMRAADQAVALREITRSAAWRLGHAASFSPIRDPAGVGNGVHVHFSFRDADGHPASHGDGPLGLSPVAAAFCAGILEHLPALLALTAPSPVSYLRLRPNRFAPTRGYLSTADREASLRVCPEPGPQPIEPARLNIEFRAADAAASPYLALGALVHAGVDGIRRRLLPPAVGVGAAFPRSLDAALDALAASEAAKAWMGATAHDAYLRHKRTEIRLSEGLGDQALCDRYATVY